MCVVAADFDVVEVLGSGSFSTVFKIRSKGVDAGVYVLKETRNLSQSEQTQAHVAREVEMLLLSRGCPSIVQYFASFVERDNHYTVRHRTWLARSLTPSAPVWPLSDPAEVVSCRVAGDGVRGGRGPV